MRRVRPTRSRRPCRPRTRRLWMWRRRIRSIATRSSPARRRASSPGHGPRISSERSPSSSERSSSASSFLPTRKRHGWSPTTHAPTCGSPRPGYSALQGFVSTVEVPPATEDDMGFLDRLFGADDSRRQAPPIPQNPNGATPSASAFRDGSGQYAPPPPSGAGARATGAGTEDQQAIERYRYLLRTAPRSEEHTSELQSLMRTSYAVFCLKKKNNN